MQWDYKVLQVWTTNWVGITQRNGLQSCTVLCDSNVAKFFLRKNLASENLHRIKFNFSIYEFVV